jgi:hypothetical protein
MKLSRRNARQMLKQVFTINLVNDLPCLIKFIEEDIEMINDDVDESKESNTIETVPDEDDETNSDDDNVNDDEDDEESENSEDDLSHLKDRVRGHGELAHEMDDNDEEIVDAAEEKV